MRVVLDLETSSTADLRKTGAQAYAEHPDTRVTVACFAVDNGPVKTWLPGQPPPQSFMGAVAAGAVIVAHNYLFEFNVLTQKLHPLGWPLVPRAQWSCTLARAYVAGLPGALEALSRVLKLSIPKDASARNLMLRMARPRSFDATGQPVWWHETDPGRYQNLQAYCRQDVEAERLLDRAVPELSPREQRIFAVDHLINQRGLQVDRKIVVALRDTADRSREQLTRELSQITKGFVTSVNQVGKLTAWINRDPKEQYVSGLRKEHIAKTLRVDLPPDIRRVLEIRRDISRSSVAKLDTLLTASSRDNRVRGCFQYYGAARTGRWAGRRFQPQNLFRGAVDPEFVPAILDAVCHGADPEDLEAVYGTSAMSVIASCLRACIFAARGRKLVIVDYAQIEARVVAWLADELKTLGTFRRGEDIYNAAARDAGSSSRLLGKVLVLACGFGMGAIRFQETARGFGLDLDLSRCIELVYNWRDNNKAIVNFWYACGNAMLNVARGHRGEIAVGRVRFLRHNNKILIRLPSGRHLVYREPFVTWDNGHDVFTYMGALGGTWTRIRTWPGKIVENITQAVARDVLADALVSLAGKGVPLVGQVHDELIAEPVEESAGTTLSQMTKVMRSPLAWAPGLPLDAKGLISDRYVKA